MKAFATKARVDMDMDKKTRLATVFDLQVPDRPPILGGWLAAPEGIWALTGCTEDE